MSVPVPGERTTGRVGKVARFLTRYGYAAASSLYLFTIGVRKPSHRALISTIAEHFGFPRTASRIPEIPLTALVPDEIEISVREPDPVDGNVTLFELLAICKLVASARPARLFEIGTFDGRTTLNLAANTPENARVFTLDLPRSALGATALPIEKGERVFAEKSESGARFRGGILESRIEQLYGDSATIDLDPYLGTMDFVFVDGSHAFRYVLADSRRATRLLSPRGGIVLWHDYGVWEGVTRALDQLFVRDLAFRGMRRIGGTSLVILDTRQT
jgi:hypothetical protein